MHILITGATGFIGQYATRLFISKGHSVTVISRSFKKSQNVFSDISVNIYEHDLNHAALPTEAFTTVDAIVNLLGESIADKRWNPAQKDKLYNSRIVGTTNLLKNLQKPVNAIVSASALGIYPPAGSTPWNENSETGNSFLSNICKDWERVAQSTPNRTVLIRIGAALGKNGGILKPLLPVFRLGLGGQISTGKQHIGWMHVEDLSQLIYQSVIDERYNGPINAVTGDPVSNSAFSKYLAKSLHRPSIFPVPAFVLKMVLGSELALAALESQYVKSVKLDSLDFKPLYPDIKIALEHIAKDC